MTFSVNLNALRGLPPSLDRRERDLDAASAYVSSNCGLSDSTGLADILGRHRRNVAAITGYLTAGAKRYASADAARLRQAIDNYAASDARAAQRYDQTLPSASTMPSGPVSATLGPEVFADHDTPTVALVRPADHEADYPYKPSWYDLLSPTSMARDLIWKLTGIAAHVGILDRAYDPFEWFVEPYVGDWAGLLRSAEAFDHVADFLGRSANTVAQAGDALTEVWRGNAAALSEANLTDFSDRLSAGESPLRDLATIYRQVANGVHDNAEMMSTAIGAMFDCGAESFVDLEGGGLAGLYEVGSMIHNFVRAVRLALHVAGTLQDIVSAGFSASDEAAHRLGILTTSVSMPAMAGASPAIPTGP